MPNQRFIFILFLLAMLWSMNSAWADEKESTLFQRFSYQVQSSQQVDNDTMHLSLFTMEEGKEPSHLSSLINERMQTVIRELKRYKEITLSNTGYSTQPIYGRQGRIDAWRVRQSIQLSSKNTALLSELAGQLQKNLQVQNIWFSVSDEQRAAVQSGLIVDALEGFKQRADVIRDTLNGNKARIIHANINTHGSSPVVKQMRRSEAFMAADAQVPVAAPQGESTITVSVHGEIMIE